GGGNGWGQGTKVSGNRKDWPFTDSTTNSAWHAGIVYNASPFISPPPPQPPQLAPQGVQAGFITGDSSISQTVTLGAGTYTLSFMAAQLAGQKISQSLQVLIGPTGTKPVPVFPQPITGTSYALYTDRRVHVPRASIGFTVPAGSYTITFQGMQQSDSTVLLDEVSIATKG